MNNNPYKYFEAKQFQVRRTQMTKGSPQLTGLQLKVDRNQSLIHDPESNQVEKKKTCQMQPGDNIFQMKQSEVQTLSQQNNQLIAKNKFLIHKLKQQQSLTEDYSREMKRLQDINTELEQLVQDLQNKIQKQKYKKNTLKQQVQQLTQDLEELQERYEQSSDQQAPLSHNQLYQLMQYLQSRAEQQQWLQENFQEYQNQEIDTDQMTYEQLLELEEHIGTVSKGLTEEEIKQIPKYTLDDDNIPDDKQ